MKPKYRIYFATRNGVIYAAYFTITDTHYDPLSYRHCQFHSISVDVSTRKPIVLLKYKI